ncbi:MAG: murein biosynthesis integral membrane protein MurJ [Candidatus Midichloria sp.]|nr:MAG: murein biosynthesis integral membrane protein MurJ [Candidatus Midichloria sp.]
MNIIKNAAVVSITILISRIFGYIRDIVIASYLGTGLLNDAFIAAFKFTNLFRNIFGEGALTAAFIPAFTYKLSQEGTKKALEMAALVRSILVITLILFCSIVIYLMPYVLKITTPGFINKEYYFEVAVTISRITFPYLFFISLAAFYGGILNSIGKFMPFAATAIIFNISIILFTLYINDERTKAHVIAYGVLAAGILEFLWMTFFLKINKMTIPIRLPVINQDIKTILNRMGAGVFGSGIVQINTWIDMVIVSFVHGGLSYIYYADRIMQLPLAIIATATSTALLPSLSRHIANNNHIELKHNKETAIKISAFFLIPSAMILCLFPNEIIRFLLERYKFDSESTRNTAAALRFLALGLPAFALIKLFSSNFHAHGDTKTPVKIAVWALLINVSISIALISILKHVAVSVASTIASWFIAIVMIKISKKRDYYQFRSQLLRELMLFIFNATVSSTFIFILLNILNTNTFISLSAGGVLYIAMYCVVNILLLNIFKIK